MSTKDIKKMVEDAKKVLGIEEDIKVEVKPMKRKIASYSFKTSTLRISRKAIERLDADLLFYIIFHELVHLKVRSIYHGKKFKDVLEKYYSKDETKIIETKIIRALL